MRKLILLLLLPLVACGRHPEHLNTAGVVSTRPFVDTYEPTTTTTVAPTTTTLRLNRPATAQRVSRGTRRTPVPVAVPVSEHSEAFWKNLSLCENATGLAPGGYFQFMGSTRAKVGWNSDQSYEQQRAEAIWWAAQIHPREGTKSGWPHCWWVALAKVN